MTQQSTPYDEKIQKFKVKLGEPMSLARNDKLSRFIEVYEYRREDYLAAVADYADLLAASETASYALHEFHPREHLILVGRGICTWKPCQALFDAIAKATPQAR